MNSSALKAENERLHFLLPSSQLELPFTPQLELNDLQIYFTRYTKAQHFKHTGIHF